MELTGRRGGCGHPAPGGEAAGGVPPGGAYDWEATQPEDAFKQLEETTERHAKIGKTVNKKVLSMFDKAEGEYKELVDKKAVVVKDKAKIQQASRRPTLDMFERVASTKSQSYVCQYEGARSVLCD
eukprot:1195489-Prorocentrum_minimum.AAC.16